MYFYWLGAEAGLEAARLNNDAIAQMQALPSVLTPITRVRKEELN